jgi:hypothetical protein
VKKNCACSFFERHEAKKEEKKRTRHKRQCSKKYHQVTVVNGGTGTCTDQVEKMKIKVFRLAQQKKSLNQRSM